MNTYLEPLHNAFESHRDPVNAEAMTNYMKGRFDYYGIKSVPRKELQKDFLREHGFPKDIEEFVRYCWDQPEREWQYFAQEICFRRKIQWPEHMHELIEFMILNKSWWDTVDFIASSIVGHWFKSNAPSPHEIIEDWNAHDDFWLNRTSIIYQLKYKEKVDEDRLFRYILPHADKNEFFIRKAIGWALRQYSKSRPERVQWFLDHHELKPLSIREASKYL